MVKWPLRGLVVIEIDPRSAQFQIRASIYSSLLRDFDEAETHVQLADSLSSDAPLALAMLVRERLLLVLALALSPSADDPDLRCTWNRNKAWAQEIAGRLKGAQIYRAPLCRGTDV